MILKHILDNIKIQTIDTKTFEMIRPPGGDRAITRKIFKMLLNATHAKLLAPPPPYPKPRPKLGFWRLFGVIRPQRFHFWWRKSSYVMHSRDKCNQRRAGQNTRSGLYVINFTHVMHINRMYFLCSIRIFIFQGHLRSYKGHQKVKSGMFTKIPALYISFDVKFGGEAKFEV